MKYLRAWLYIALAGAARRLRAPAGLRGDLDDAATLRKFDCWTDFEAAGVTSTPRGWQCPHVNITFGGAVGGLTAPSMYCGCKMHPILSAS